MVGWGMIMDRVGGGGMGRSYELGGWERGAGDLLRSLMEQGRGLGCNI